MSSVTQIPLSTATTTISLQGSAEIVSEFFYYSVNSIMQTREIFPRDSFSQHRMYGTCVCEIEEKETRDFVKNFCDQTKKWLADRSLQRLVLVFKNLLTGEPVERWQFDVVVDSKVPPSSQGDVASQNVISDKPEEIITAEIRAIMTQITASVSFLPLLNCKVGFELLAYTEPDANMPSGWLDTDGHDLKKANRVNVPLRYFSTGLHGVRPSVSYSDPAPALLQRSNPRARMPLRSTPLSTVSSSASTSIAFTPLLDRKLQ